MYELNQLRRKVYREDGSFYYERVDRTRNIEHAMRQPEKLRKGITKSALVPDWSWDRWAKKSSKAVSWGDMLESLEIDLINNLK